MSATDEPAIVLLVLTWNYMQNLAFLKLGVNTKFVLGLPYDIHRVFEQQKNHLRSGTCDRRPPPPTPPSAEKVTLSSVFFKPFPNIELGKQIEEDSAQTCLQPPTHMTHSQILS